MKNLAICVFGHTRGTFIGAVLESLRLQGAMEHVHVWLDGHQGNAALKAQTERVWGIVSQFPVAAIHRHNGQLGFRKLLLQALSEIVREYRSIIVLEDDCFPTRHAVRVFRHEIATIAELPEIFSVYGHPFLLPAETDTCTRFQGWGWGTTREKLVPVLEELIECYSLSERDYLHFVDQVLTDEVVSRIDVTPPRLVTMTLRRFFAWDETLALLTALRGQVHKPTVPRTIYNFGVGEDSSHFRNIAWCRMPPYNMIPPEEIWTCF